MLQAETASTRPSAPSCDRATVWNGPAVRVAGPSYPVWSWLNVASLDAPLIAILWQACFATSFGVALSWYQPLCLVLLTWCIYAADRCIDGLRLDPRLPHAARHRFHRQHRVSITTAVMVAAAVCAMLVIGWMSGVERWFGFVLAMVTLLHCGGRRLLGRGFVWMKELTIGGVFALAVSHATMLTTFHVDVVVAFILAWTLFTANCLVIGAIERPVDRAQQFHSSEQRFGNLAALLSVLLLAVTAAAFGACVRGLIPRAFAFSIVLAAVGLAVVQRFSHRLPRDARTALAEASLFSPALVWLLFDG